jgi:hypothetical protein
MEASMSRWWEYDNTGNKFDAGPLHDPATDRAGNGGVMVFIGVFFLVGAIVGGLVLRSLPIFWSGLGIATIVMSIGGLLLKSSQRS